jgi:ABC-type phosphate/phosphonate transport system substrate-binding protein
MEICKKGKAIAVKFMLPVQSIMRGVLFLFLLFGFSSNAPLARGEELPNPMRLGIVQTFFRDVPESMVGVAMKPFSALMKIQTGFESELAPPTDTETLSEWLSKNKVQLALFEGVEFAWVHQNHPDLHPLVIAVNEHRNRQAFVVVRQESNINHFSDLQGKKMAIPRRSRSHCHLFVERLCRENGKEVKDFFAKVITSSGAEAFLDDLGDDLVQAVIVDREALDCYKRRKPGRFAKLKELQKSELFPDSVVAFRSGVIDGEVLNRFKEGLKAADTTALGRQLLLLWNMTAFEEVPADFEKSLVDIAKHYPPPKSARIKETGANKAK